MHACVWDRKRGALLEEPQNSRIGPQHLASQHFPADETLAQASRSQTGLRTTPKSHFATFLKPGRSLVDRMQRPHPLHLDLRVDPASQESERRQPVAVMMLQKAVLSRGCDARLFAGIHSTRMLTLLQTSQHAKHQCGLCMSFSTHESFHL